MASRFTARGILLALALALCSAAAVAALDRIVAVVNDEVVLASELERKVDLVRSQLRGQGTRMPPPDVLERQVLERLVVERLQLQLAERNGIQVDDETLNRSLRRIAEQNGMTLERFRAVVEGDGYAFADFREDIRNEIIINRLRQQMVENRVNVTEPEVSNQLDTMAARQSQNREYHLGHILVSVPEAAAPEEIQAARQRAEALVERLRGGADFGQTAVAESAGQQALEGGDLGWRKAGELPTLFAEVVTGMSPGDISDVIRSPSGFHIVKLLEVRGEQRHVVRQTHARHILLKTDDISSDAVVHQRLEQLHERIAAGEDFGELARAHSQDPGSAANGGDLGWVNPGEMVPRFEEVMNELPPGGLSEPFRTEYGWHLVQVLDRREHDSTQAYQRARAREMVRSRKVEEEMEVWLRRLRDEAYVEYRLDG